MFKFLFSLTSNPAGSFHFTIIAWLPAIAAIVLFFTSISCSQTKYSTCEEYAQLSYNSTLLVCQALTIFASDTSDTARQQAELIRATLRGKVLADCQETQNLLHTLVQRTKDPYIQDKLLDLSNQMAEQISSLLNGSSP